jgi:UDP-N-acetyl-D-mannosaminuronic acid dehydrogenase
LGFAYKGDVADVRETPAIAVINKLLKKGAEVVVHDPFVDDGVIESYGFQPCSLEEVFGCDCVVLITDHAEFKKITPDMIENNVMVCTRPILDPEVFKQNGVLFRGIGRVN